MMVLRHFQHEEGEEKNEEQDPLYECDIDSL